MSLETLLKNFGDKKPPVTIAKDKLLTEKLVAAGIAVSASVDACEQCGQNFFWRYNGSWFCGVCRRPPTADLVHETRNGEFVKWMRWKDVFKYQPKQVTEEVSSSNVDAYDSVVVAEGDGVCPACPCRWVREIPNEDGSLLRTCYSCKAVIASDRHGSIPDFSQAPIHLLPFWQWFHGRKKT